MTNEQAVKTIELNAIYIPLMQQNIDEGLDVETCQEIIDALFTEIVEAKKYLATQGIFAV